MKSKHIWINSFLLIASLVSGVAIGEIMARIFFGSPHGHALFSKQSAEAHAALLKTISDVRLLHRVPPNSRGHDERGFRNPPGRDTAEIVVIGDSQTWGINVRRDETWPAMLETIGQMSVYSMSLGGWGPIQYELLAIDALALQPKAILVGMYLGNDIFDSCNHVYGTDLYQKYRQTDAAYTSSLSDLQRRLKAAQNSTREDDARHRLEEMGATGKMVQALARRSVLVQILMSRGLLPAIPSVDELYEIADVAWAQGHPMAAYFYRGSNGSTVLTFGYRGVAVDLGNACIREGVRITKEVVVSLQALGARTGIQVGIVFIPSKEFVYASADPVMGTHIDGGLEDLVGNERAIKADLLGQCEAVGIVCVDAAPLMVTSAQHGVPLYRGDSDGHPIAEGYRQIARAGQQVLKSMGVHRETR